MIPHSYKPVPLSMIDVPTDRLRTVKPERVETLAKDIAANGLLQPVGLVEEESGRFTLTFGAHRLAAVGSLKGPLKREEIDARVTPAQWIKTQERRMQEVMENLNREDCTALERAEALAELKRVYEELHPETRKGVAGGKARQKTASEIFSFAENAAQATGLSRRSIELAVAMVNGLSDATKARLRGTAIERKAVDLRALAETDAAIQAKALDLLFSEPPQAVSVAEAIQLASGKRPDRAEDKAFRRAVAGFARLPKRARFAFFDGAEAEIRAWASQRGLSITGDLERPS